VSAPRRPRAQASERASAGVPGADPDLAHERIYIRLLPLIKQSQKDSNGATPRSLPPLSLSLSLSLSSFSLIPGCPPSPRCILRLSCSPPPPPSDGWGRAGSEVGSSETEFSTPTRPPAVTSASLPLRTVSLSNAALVALSFQPGVSPARSRAPLSLRRDYTRVIYNLAGTSACTRLHSLLLADARVLSPRVSFVEGSERLSAAPSMARVLPRERLEKGERQRVERRGLRGRLGVLP